MNTKATIIMSLFVIAAGLGLYGIFGTSGNTLAVASNNSGCTASIERGKTLDPLATGDLAAFRALDEPLDMKNIRFFNADGQSTSLADWNGKIVLFNLWATWCPPCREEMPYFETLQTTKAGEEFQVVAVSIDLGDASKPKAFYEETGLRDLSFYHDNTMEAFQILKRKAVALGMPTTILVDRNGCGLGVLNGPALWAGEDAIRLIDAAIELPGLVSG